MALQHACLLTASSHQVSTGLPCRDRSSRKPSSLAITPRHARQRCDTCPRRSAQQLVTRAIGFDLGTETGKGTDKHADNLTRAASSLLLYQNVLKGRPGQAFLKLLLLLQKGRVQDILEAYGEFYSSLAAGNYMSWQDYLLEEVLTGKFNTFAKAAAKGELPKSSPLHRAAAFDLDILQKLAVAETTLVSWVEDVSRSLPEGWATAAAAYGPSTTVQQEAATAAPLELPHDLVEPKHILVPLTPAQRTAYRAKIGGKWKWSEALPELQYYYEAHGFGITAVNSTLKWAGGFLEAYNPPTDCHLQQEAECSTAREDTTAVKGYISNNNRDFMADKGHSPSILLHAHSLAPILLWEWQQQNPHHNIRFVRLAASDVSQLADVAYALQQYPRIKFVVYCDCLTAAEGSASYAVLHNVLTGVEWPKNALFYASSHGSVESIAELIPCFVTTLPLTYKGKQ